MAHTCYIYTLIWCSLYPEQEIYRFRNLFNFVYGINSYGRRSARDLSRYLLCYDNRFSLAQNGPIPFKVINIKFKQQDRISEATFMTFKNANKICCHNFGIKYDMLIARFTKYDVLFWGVLTNIHPILSQVSGVLPGPNLLVCISEAAHWNKFMIWKKEKSFIAG